MLDIRVARDLLVLVNQPDFQELMNLYIEEKKKEQHRLLEQCDDDMDMFRAQGACQFLHKLTSMKTEVQSAAKRD